MTLTDVAEALGRSGVGMQPSEVATRLGLLKQWFDRAVDAPLIQELRLIQGTSQFKTRQRAGWRRWLCVLRYPCDRVAARTLQRDRRQTARVGLESTDPILALTGHVDAGD